MTQEKIDRINELARKAKTAPGLTDAEKSERQSLRQEYVAAVKSSLQRELDHTWVVDETGHKRKLTGGKT